MAGSMGQAPRSENRRMDPINPGRGGPGGQRKRQTFTVREEDGLKRRGFPVRVSVDIPQGALTDCRRVRLLNHEGIEIPVQAKPVVSWPDGSIRSLLLEFAAHLRPYQERKYTLEYGKDIWPREQVFIQAHQTKDGIRVQSDIFSLRFAAGSQNWMDSVWVVGRPFTPKELGVRGYLLLGGSQGDLRDAKLTVEAVRVAEQGPVQVTVAAEGRFSHHKWSIPVQFQARVYYTGYIYAAHTLAFESEEDAKSICACGFEVPLAVKSHGSVEFGVVGAEPIKISAGDCPIFEQKTSEAYAVCNKLGVKAASGRGILRWVELSAGGLKLGATIQGADRYAPMKVETASYGGTPVLRLSLYSSPVGSERTRRVLLHLAAE